MKFSTEIPWVGTKRWSISTSLEHVILLVFGISITVALIFDLCSNLHSRIAHDTPVMMYIAMMIERFHQVPYRQIVDFNMPGSYLIYVMIGKVSGYSDFGIRIVESTLLVFLCLTTYAFLRKINPWISITAPVLFACLYLTNNNLSLQREFFMLLLISTALVFSFSDNKSRYNLLVSNLLIGMCVTIKPQAALVFPLLLSYNLGDAKDKKQVALYSVAAAALPSVIMLGYLVHMDALDAFLSMTRHYWPLYASMDGHHRVLRGSVRLYYILCNTPEICGYYIWIGPAIVGTYLALRIVNLSDIQTRQVKLLAALTIVFAIYPAFSGQFWEYHGLPFLYFAVLLSSFCLLPISSRQSSPLFVIGKVLLGLIAIVVLVPQVWGLPVIPTPEHGRADQIASYLSKHLQPGDRVQPMDWTGGGDLHALLKTKTQSATPFVYDFYFYHSVSSPYIQRLRQQFITDLRASPPRYILQTTTKDQPWPSGPDTTRKFPAFDNLLKSSYHQAQNQNGYIIWERN